MIVFKIAATIDLFVFLPLLTVTGYLKIGLSSLCFVIVAVLLVQLRLLQLRARAGDFEAANELLLPVYWWLVVAFSMTYFIDGLYLMGWDLNDNDVVCIQGDDFDCTVVSLMGAFELACRRMVVDGAAVFLMHYGAGRASVRRTALVIVPWGVFVGLTEFLWEQRPLKDRDEGNHDQPNPLQVHG